MKAIQFAVTMYGDIYVLYNDGSLWLGINPRLNGEKTLWVKLPIPVEKG